jgi:hypothetical protein
MGPIHKQLLGTWRSAKGKTLRTYGAYQSFSRAKQRRIGAIFGKLELRYTPRFCFLTLNRMTTRERYEVIAEDADSIVVRTYSDQMRKRVDPIILSGIEELFAPKLQHFHLESIRGRDYYWVGIRVFVEWFVRRPTKRSTERRGAR